jgi:putative metalloprotease
MQRARIRFIWTPVLTLSLVLAGGCQTVGVNDALSIGGKVVPAMTLNDQQMADMARAGIEQSDRENRVAASNSSYQKRLNRLTGSLRSVNGRPLNYKVYLTDEVNAFASPDGSIRVYSGLMDMMDDDELLFVIGHEVGHIAKGHSKQRYRAALLTSAGRQAAASFGGAEVGAIAGSQAGAFLETVVNAQFSQANEREADDYGMATLKRAGQDPNGAVSALNKLAAKSRSGSNLVAQMVSTHPQPASRAARLQKQISAG